MQTGKSTAVRTGPGEAKQRTGPGKVKPQNQREAMRMRTGTRAAGLLFAGMFLSVCALSAFSLQGASLPLTGNASGGKAEASVQASADNSDMLPMSSYNSAILPMLTDSSAVLPASSGNGALFEYTCLPGNLPSRYSVTDAGKGPAVKSQGSLNTCWALTACSALESSLLPETKTEFSADHMSLRNGYDTVQADGGDYQMILSYLADWKGPVLEKEDPYGDGISPEGLQAAVHVQDIRILRGMSRDQIRQTILTRGAVQSSLSMDRMRTDSDDFHYYNEKTAAYYDPFTEKLNHDVLVLGWDDTYARENFRIRPRRDGAWICQNTWGEHFGDGGIFYVSYEDRNLFRKGGLSYGRILEKEAGEKVSSADTLGWLGRQGYGQERCCLAGVFHADSMQTMTGVGFYTTGPYTGYCVYLIPYFETAADLRQAAEHARGVKETDALFLSAGQFAHPGFHTADISGRIGLCEGQTYAVVILLDTWHGEKPAAVELQKDRYTDTVLLEGRETYLSRDGMNWENTQEKYATNVCMKVFTKDAGPCSQNF